MINKTYKYIVINKNNMKEFNHYNHDDSIAFDIFNFNKDFNPDNWIIIYNEKEILNLSEMKTFGGDKISQFRKLKELLKNEKII